MKERVKDTERERGRAREKERDTAHQTMRREATKHWINPCYTGKYYASVCKSERKNESLHTREQEEKASH